MDLLEKINKLREEYTYEEDKKRMSNLSLRVQKLMAQNNAKNIAGVKLAVEELKIKIKDISKLLCFSRDLEETERRRLFQERDDCQWFISFFCNEEDLENINKFIESEIEN